MTTRWLPWLALIGLSQVVTACGQECELVEHGEPDYDIVHPLGGRGKPGGCYRIEGTCDPGGPSEEPGRDSDPIGTAKAEKDGTVGGRIDWIGGTSTNRLELCLNGIKESVIEPGEEGPAEISLTVEESDNVFVAVSCSGSEANREYVAVVRIPEQGLFK